jgi:hypothetical protein
MGGLRTAGNAAAEAEGEAAGTADRRDGAPNTPEAEEGLTDRAARDAAAEVTAAKGEAVGEARRAVGAAEGGKTRAGGARVDGIKPGAVGAAGAVATTRSATSAAPKTEGEAAGTAWDEGTAAYDTETRADVVGVGGVGLGATGAACETQDGENARETGGGAARETGAVEIAPAIAKKGPAGVPIEGVIEGVDGRGVTVPEAAGKSVTAGKAEEVAAKGAYAARKFSTPDEEGENVAPVGAGMAVAIVEATWAG